MEINKDFVRYEQSFALKELGFDERCFGFFYTDDEKNYKEGFFDNRRDFIIDAFQTKDGEYDSYFINKEERTDYVSAPTFSQAFRFFREKFNWQHSIDPTSDQNRSELGYNYWIWNPVTGEEYYTMPKNRPIGDWEYETYEEAESACLNKLIEITKTNHL